MSVLTRKLLRDLRAQRGSSWAVLSVMALGVMLFVASAGAYRDLRDSYASTRQQLALAGLHLQLAAPLTPAQKQRVEALPGVALAEPRLVAELPASPGESGALRAALRVLSLPDAREPRLDQVHLLEGSFPKEGEVLLEKHFAARHHLGAGAALLLGGEGGALRVSGVGVSAEYLWVARSQNDFFPSPDEFGVGWMREAALRTVVGEGQPLVELLVAPRAGVSLAVLMAALREALEPGQVLSATPSAELPGVKLLQLDVDGYKGMAGFFPLFFLGVGAFIMGSVLARLVDAQRALIGTFLALGISRGAVLRHFMSIGLVLGGGGSLLGAALGLITAPAMTQAYAQELNIPFVQVMDSMRTTFEALFSTALRYDARVDFAQAVAAGPALDAARSVRGVSGAEGLLALPARLRAHGAEVDVLLQVLDEGAQLVRSVDADGVVTPPGAGGLVLTRSAVRALKLAVGEPLQVTPLGSEVQVTLRLTGFGDAAMGNTATVRRMDVEAPWGLAGQVTSVVATTGPEQGVREGLVKAFPAAVRVEDTAATRALFAEVMGLGWLMLGLMLAFGGVLAGAILFNTATLLVLERQRELATLRALGLRMREVALLVTAQHALLALVGLGLPLAVGAAKAMLGAFSSELFALPFVLEPGTVTVTLVGVFVLVLLAQWPALRRVSRASLAEVVRERG